MTPAPAPDPTVAGGSEPVYVPGEVIARLVLHWVLCLPLTALCSVAAEAAVPGVFDSLSRGQVSPLVAFVVFPIALLWGVCAGICFCTRAPNDVRRGGQLTYGLLTFLVALFWSVPDDIHAGPVPIWVLALCAYAASSAVFRFWPKPASA